MTQDRKRPGRITAEFAKLDRTLKDQSVCCENPQAHGGPSGAQKFRPRDLDRSEAQAQPGNPCLKAARLRQRPAKNPTIRKRTEPAFIEPMQGKPVSRSRRCQRMKVMATEMWIRYCHGRIRVPFLPVPQRPCLILAGSVQQTPYKNHACANCETLPAIFPSRRLPDYKPGEVPGDRDLSLGEPKIGLMVGYALHRLRYSRRPACPPSRKCAVECWRDGRREGPSSNNRSVSLRFMI